MEELEFEPTFAGWQKVAREALRRDLSPADILWRSRTADQQELSLFTGELHLVQEDLPSGDGARFRVPREFIRGARTVSCCRDDARWPLLYRMLWRLTHGEPHLLEVATDPDTIQFAHFGKVVGRDVHKMRAFVRFREVITEEGVRWFVAWFEPQHLIVELNAPFFVDRFAAMNWSLLTPDQCAHWDQRALTFSPGLSREHAPLSDEVESLWRTYYRNIFNPARVKVAAMKKEMAPYYWRNLPEAQEIPGLLADAPLRMAGMVAASQAKAPARQVRESAPVPNTNDWSVVRDAANACQACPLWRDATCTVFGQGPRTARVMFVGEQPGDQEDRAGEPFVGPAGKLLDRALAAAGVSRSELYLTNAVKHFKWEPRGKRRLHQTPNSREIDACRPWLEKEIDLIRPELLVCMGATAVQAVVGEGLKVTQERGRLHPTRFNIPALVTLHPSALLRQPDADRAEKDFQNFVSDLQQIGTQGTTPAPQPPTDR